MILELLFLLFVALAVFFGMRALRALIIRRWIENALAEGILIEQQENDDAPSK
jgi:hypothetical protein